MTKTSVNVRRHCTVYTTPFWMVSFDLCPQCTHSYPTIVGSPCDVDGFDLTPGTSPPSPPSPPQNPSDDSSSNWFPFSSQAQFETADFLFRKAEMSQADIDTLMR